MPAAITLPDGTSTDTVKWHRRRFQELQKEREPFMSVWEDVRAYLAPGLVRSFQGDAAGPIKQALDTSRVIDTTATHALDITSAGMMAGITSPARRWMRTQGRADAPDEHKQWLQHLDDELFRFWNRTDLYAMLMGIYPEVLLFGTAAGFGIPHTGVGESDFIWGQFLAGSYAIAEDADGVVRTVYWDTNDTVSNLVSRYGLERLTVHTRQLWEHGQWGVRIPLVHVLQRTALVGEQLRGESPWEHVVFERDSTEREDLPGAFLERMSLEVFPAFVVRWERNSLSPWGIGPGSLVLPDVRQLQEMEEKKAAALSLHISPPMVGDPSIQGQRVSTLPGDVTFVAGAAQGRPGFAPAYQVQPRLADFAADMELVRARIRNLMHTPLFMAFIERPGIQPLNESEIWERKEEKLVGLGPVMDRLDREMLRPIIEISYAYLRNNGLLDEPPEDLRELDVEYLNVIAIAQRTQGLTAISDTVSFISTLAQAQAGVGLSPTAMDYLNEEEVIRSFASRRGADVNILRSEEEVEELQDARAQAAAEQAQLEQATAAAGAVKDMAGAEELSARTEADLGPGATGAGPGALPASVGV